MNNCNGVILSVVFLNFKTSLSNSPQTVKLKVSNISYVIIIIQLYSCYHQAGLPAFSATSFLLTVIFKVAILITLKAVRQIRLFVLDVWIKVSRTRFKTTLTRIT